MLERLSRCVPVNKSAISHGTVLDSTVVYQDVTARPVNAGQNDRNPNDRDRFGRRHASDGHNPCYLPAPCTISFRFTVNPCATRFGVYFRGSLRNFLSQPLQQK